MSLDLRTYVWYILFTLIDPNWSPAFFGAKGEKTLAELIRESFIKRKTCPFHKVALDLFQEYLFVGGMPETVIANVQGKNTYEIDAIKQKIIDIYKNWYIII